jgi:hypothetical protein
LAASKRWKTGQNIIRIPELLLFRGNQPTAMDHINIIYKEYDSWKKALKTKD